MFASLPSPENIIRVELSNGITVLARQNHNCQSVNIGGYLQVGSLFEPDDKLGMADFTASMLMRGTQRRSFQQIFDHLESAGASLDFSGGTHTTSFGAKALAEDIDLILDIMSEVIQFPSFPIEYVERLRGQCLTHLAIRDHDTASMAVLAFDQIIYANHPYSRPEDGYPYTVSTITDSDLTTFHRRFYRPRGMVIAIVGALEPERAIEKIEYALGGWQNPDIPDIPILPSLTQLNQMVTKRIFIPGKSQVDILIGAAGPSHRHPAYLAALLGNNILGQFGMYGRIGEIMREQAGLAYYASSTLSGGVGPGPWTIDAGVAPQNVERAVDLIREEVARFVREPVSREELDDTVSYFIGILPLSMETNEGMAAAIVDMERYQLGMDYYLRYADTLRSVTSEEILMAAQHFLHPDRLGIAIAGPMD
jgi:zinc protease